jgi:hypothetical protein
MKERILMLCAAVVMCPAGLAFAHDEKTKTAPFLDTENARIARCVNFLTTFGLATGERMGVFEKIRVCQENPTWGSRPASTGR